MKTTLLALVIPAALCVAGASSGGDGRGPTALADLSQFDNVEFITVCKFTHFAPDDPIVHYKMPGMSHDHSFFGNVTTNAFSTLTSLRKGATFRFRPEDTASYWAPTLLLNNKRVTLVSADVYYRRSTLTRVKPFPPGLNIVGSCAVATMEQTM